MAIPATAENTPPTVMGLALSILHESAPETKAMRSQEGYQSLISEAFPIGEGQPPATPARPEKPELRRPGEMPRRRKSQSAEGRKALLHALAHIEFNAIDLAWDIIARFVHSIDASLQAEFVRDWAGVAADEGRHFLMVQNRLRTYDMAYGDLPAHDGLWQTAQITAHDLLARLALVPLLHEARGLDVTPAMVIQLRQAGDEASAAVLQTIHDEEINHVAIGQKWFSRLCTAKGLEPKAVWQNYVQSLFTGHIKPPFNTQSRDKAGFPSDWYEPMVHGD